MRAIICLFFLLSCATKRPEGSTEAEILYKEAVELKNSSHFIQANEKLNTVRSQFPYSLYATSAELMQAEILFAQGNYVEAAAAYSLFREFHPKHQDIPEVIYRLSESYYKQLPATFDRDLSAGIEAMKYLRELMYNYSTHPKAVEAQKKIEQIEDLLLKKEIYIADFYFKTDDFKAAKSRYEDVVKRVKDNGEKLRILSRIDLCTTQITNN